MKRFFSGLVVAVLILTFVVCIYCYGENRRFSLEYYIENISEIQSGIWLSSLGEVWTSNGYTISYPITDNRYEGSGAGPGGGDNAGGFERVSFSPYEGTNEVLKFLDNIRIFFLRLGATFRILGNALVCVFKDFRLLLPWNATVTSDGTRVPIETEAPAETDAPDTEAPEETETQSSSSSGGHF